MTDLHSDQHQPSGQAEPFITPSVARQLDDEDMRRVERYLSSPIHKVERKPFRPWLMMLGLVAVVAGLSLLSLFISWLALD